MDEPMEDPAPPSELPEGVADVVESLSATQLRKLVEYAQTRLRFMEGPISDFIETGEDGEIVRMEDYGHYAVVVKRQKDEADSDSAEPPHLYVVTIEAEPEGGHYLHWADLGTVID